MTPLKKSITIHEITKWTHKHP